MNPSDLQSLITDWKRCVTLTINNAESTDNLAEYALNLSRILAYPNMDVERILKSIDSMGEELRDSIKKLLPLRPTQIIEKINDFIYTNKGFKPNIQDYYNPSNSYLNCVLEQKTGIPITLSILYMRIAKILNFKLYPVNFPAHFLVKHVLEGDNGEIIIDAFNHGRIMDDYSLKALLDQFYPNQNVPLTRAFVEKATSAQVMIRMLNNLKTSYFECQDIEMAEKANEMILAIEEFNPQATRDKGMIMLKQEKFDRALELLKRYLEVDPEATDADTILDIIRQLRSDSAERSKI